MASVAVAARAFPAALWARAVHPEKRTHAHLRSFLRAACAASVLFAAPADAAPTPILKGPYLQELGPSGVTIRAELDPPSSVTVEASREGDAPIRVVDNDAQAFHSLRLDKLKPLSHYRYVLRTGGGASYKGEFTTAPAPSSAPDPAAPFTFLIYGDNRSDDAGHALVVRAMMQAPADFLVHTGDFVQSGGNPIDWQTFFEIERSMLANRCVFSCVGNHELFNDQSAVNYTRYFGPSSGGRLYSTFRWGNTRFFMLNAFHDWSSGDERTWLDKELSSADGEAGLTWRVAVVHHGPWSAGPHGSSPTLVPARIPQLLSQHKIDLVVSGHDHIYERGDAMGLRYIVSGGGGAPVYRDIKPLASTRKVEASHHFVEVNVTSDAVKLTTKRSDGSLLERCGFTKKAGWDCDVAAAASATAAAPAGGAGSLLSAAPSPSPAESPSTSRCGCRAAGALGDAHVAAFAALALTLFLARRKTR
jgi:predicted phosphodiesterase